MVQSILHGLRDTPQLDQHGDALFPLAFGLGQVQIFLSATLSFQHSEPGLGQLIGIPGCFSDPGPPVAYLSLQDPSERRIVPPLFGGCLGSIEGFVDPILVDLFLPVASRWAHCLRWEEVNSTERITSAQSWPSSPERPLASPSESSSISQPARYSSVSTSRMTRALSPSPASRATLAWPITCRSSLTTLPTCQ